MQDTARDSTSKRMRAFTESHIYATKTEGESLFSFVALASTKSCSSPHRSARELQYAYSHNQSYIPLVYAFRTVVQMHCATLG